MSKIIKYLGVTSVILPILLCIIAQFYHFDFGRIMIDAVMILTGVVGIRVVFHQLKIKEKELEFQARQMVGDIWILIILLGICALEIYLCIMSMIDPAFELFQIPAFYLIAIFGFRMNHKAVFATNTTLYYDFEQYELNKCSLAEHRDDGGHAAFRIKYRRSDFWVVMSHREGKAFQAFLRRVLR